VGTGGGERGVTSSPNDAGSGQKHSDVDRRLRKKDEDENKDKDEGRKPT